METTQNEADLTFQRIVYKNCSNKAADLVMKAHNREMRGTRLSMGISWVITLVSIVVVVLAKVPDSDTSKRQWKYGEQVEIVDGYYTGQAGIIVDEPEVGRVSVSLFNEGNETHDFKSDFVQRIPLQESRVEEMQRLTKRLAQLSQQMR